MITTGQLNGRGQNSSKNFNHMLLWTPEVCVLANRVGKRTNVF